MFVFFLILEAFKPELRRLLLQKQAICPMEVMADAHCGMIDILQTIRAISGCESPGLKIVYFSYSTACRCQETHDIRTVLDPLTCVELVYPPLLACIPPG